MTMPNEATGSNPLPPHVHALMAEDQAEILRLRADFAALQSSAHDVEAARQLAVVERDEALGEVNRLYADIEAHRMAADEASRELARYHGRIAGLQLQRDRAVRERTTMQTACHRADAELADARAEITRLLDRTERLDIHNLRLHAVIDAAIEELSSGFVGSIPRLTPVINKLQAALRQQDQGLPDVDYGPVWVDVIDTPTKPPYGSPERAAYDSTEEQQ